VVLLQFTGAGLAAAVVISLQVSSVVRQAAGGVVAWLVPVL
jgi:hypothetical protein